ncbi:MAG: tetratricopeptide repeat protein [Bacteroidota bacterium]|nr:tetratricopeptide repeat protein [Bacteroidota bacterium]
MRKLAGFGCLYILCFFGKASAQQERLDSLLRVEKSYLKQDSSRVILLIELMKECRKLKRTKERFVYANEAVSLGEKIHCLSPLPPIYNNLGLYYEGRSEFEKSIFNYERAISISEQKNDLAHAADYTLNYGTVYHTLGDYPRALTLYQKAANYYIATGQEEDAANCFINMGGIYSEFPDQNEKAMTFVRKSLFIFQKMGKEGKRGVAEACMSIAGIYRKATEPELRKMGIPPEYKFDSSRKYLTLASTIASETEDEELQAEVSTATGLLEETLANYNLAIKDFQYAISVYEKLDRKSYANNCLINLGRVYKKQSDLTNGLIVLKKALASARQMNIIDQQKEALFNISQIYENQHAFDSAYFFYKAYIVMQDSIYNNDNQKLILRKQLQFEFNNKERVYQLNQQISENKLKEQEDLAIRQRQELDIRNKQLELSEREQEIQKLNYLKKQAALISEQKLKTFLLNQKDLEKKLATSMLDKKIDQQKSEIHANTVVNRFLVLTLLLFSLAGIYIFRTKQKTAKLNAIVLAQKTSLEELGKVKDKIFSIVSHDMRAPVNNLLAFNELLNEGGISQEKLSNYLEKIKGTLDHTSTMMENLLNWSASQMQGFNPVIEKVSLNQTVANIAREIEPALRKKKISLENTIPHEVFVNADKNMLELVVRNIVSNAIKFSEHHGKIEMSTSLDEDKKVILSVKDSGIGLNSDQVKNINSDSVKALESSYGTDREKGTGLGLMLCKHFIQLMKGHLSVESHLGRGSLFKITLLQA